MPVTAHETFGLLLFGLLLSVIPLYMFTLIMHFLMPKAVLARYWKQPHFRPFELTLFTGAPYAPMRTIMLMGVLAFPRCGKKRKLTHAYLSAPMWYRAASMVLVIWPFVVLIGTFIILGGFYICPPSV